ncbi:ribonuclease H2 subunit C-like [Lytechinus pictus]|uniref:ribonuclease H2 subunit C-like n=1 Tax=Lytechinus pictus TaxID=7653 RepID=UPI0030BA20E2
MALCVDGKSLENVGCADLRLMPCTIEGDGEANVSQFFTPAIRQNEESPGTTGQQVSFRGRLLRGQEIPIPEGYKGVILKEPSKPFTEDEDRTLKATHSFDKFTYWNLETAPSTNDTIQRALAWTNIASAIHSPVSSDKPSLESQGSVAGCR